MRIRLVVVGRLKEKYWIEAAEEYLKRLSPYALVEIVEVSEERLPDNPGPAEIRQAVEKEGQRILKQLPPAYFTIALAIAGEMTTSEGLAALFRRIAVESGSRAIFVIGGSHGLSPQILEKSDLCLSFSRLTFPHQLMRVILLEQVYRAFNMINGGKYHK